MVTDEVRQPCIVGYSAGIDGHRHVTDLKGQRLLLVKLELPEKRFRQDCRWAAEIYEGENFAACSVGADERQVGVHAIAVQDNRRGARRWRLKSEAWTAESEECKK